MKRMHIHIAVDDLNKSINFYNTLFAANPSVVKADYAKWMLDDPLVNFAISQRGAKAGLDHIGIQVDSEQELAAIKANLDQAELNTLTQQGTTCCYAKSDKHWVIDPSGIAWETYHTLDSAPTFNDSDAQTSADSACCAPTPQTVQFISRKK
jgi:predicted lactoylglutathione lyase